MTGRQRWEWSLATIAGVALGEDGRARVEHALEQFVALACERDVRAFSVDLDSLRDLEARGGTVVGLARTLERAGARCSDVVALRLSSGPGHALAEQRALRRIREVADHLGPAWCVVVLDAEVDAALLDRLGRYAQSLAVGGMAVAIEPMPYAHVDRIAAAREVCCGLPASGVVLDSWHFLSGPDDWPDLAVTPGEQVALVQLADVAVPSPFDPRWSSRHNRRLPGTGCGDLGRFLDLVAAAGYRGPVCVEVLSDELRARPTEDLVDRFIASIQAITASC